MFALGSTIPEASPSRRRSSSEDNAPDMEGSVYSARRIPPLQTTFPRAGRTGRTGKSPMATARSLANKLNFMKDSITSSVSGDNIWTAKTDYAWDTRLLFKRRIMTLFISLTSLKSYVEVNYSGFRKILKKYEVYSIYNPCFVLKLIASGTTK